MTYKKRKYGQQFFHAEKGVERIKIEDVIPLVSYMSAAYKNIFSIPTRIAKNVI